MLDNQINKVIELLKSHRAKNTMDSARVCNEIILAIPNPEFPMTIATLVETHMGFYTYPSIVTPTGGTIIKPHGSALRKLYEIYKTKPNFKFMGDKSRNYTSILDSHVAVYKPWDTEDRIATGVYNEILFSTYNSDALVCKFCLRIDAPTPRYIDVSKAPNFAISNAGHLLYAYRLLKHEIKSLSFPEGPTPFAEVNAYLAHKSPEIAEIKDPEVEWYNTRAYELMRAGNLQEIRRLGGLV